jgi:hypothetical protein
MKNTLTKGEVLVVAGAPAPPSSPPLLPLSEMSLSELLVQELLLLVLLQSWLSGDSPFRYNHLLYPQSN